MRQRLSDPVTRTAVAIALAAGTYAISYGVLAINAGLSVAQTCAMSLRVVTGASQFAVVGVLGAGGGTLAALAPALILAARNGLYGLSLAPLVRGRFAVRALQSQLVIDETTAMARAQDTPGEARRAFLTTGVCLFVCWNIGTLIGALLGSGIGDSEALGLDAMFPAAFLALLVPQLDRPGARLAAICGGVVALVLVPFVPAGVPILAAVLGVIPAMGALRRAAQETP